MKRLNLVYGVMFALASASCGDPVSPDASDLNAARERWAAHGYATYAATVTTLCFCAYTNPMRVLVVRDTIGSVVDTKTGETIDKHYTKSITELFATIDSAIARPAASLHVTYDATLGFPTRIDIDWVANAIDDEVVYTVTDVSAAAIVRERSP